MHLVLQDIPDDEVSQHLASNPLQAPELVLFFREDKFIGSFIVADGVTIKVTSVSTSASLVALLAVYYVFQLEYPRRYSQLLGLL